MVHTKTVPSEKYKLFDLTQIEDFHRNLGEQTNCSNMVYFWTTFEDRGAKIDIQDGGHYEALDRNKTPAPVKTGVGGLTPSSDVPELCVSGSPEASLFAKVQSTQRNGVYYIYRTEKQPDVKPSRTGLDFDVIEEYRYNMDKQESVTLEHHNSVKVSEPLITDIQEAYDIAERNSVNRRYAKKIKENIRRLLNGSGYPINALEEARAERFRDFAESYGEEQAKELFEDIPDEYKQS